MLFATRNIGFKFLKKSEGTEPCARGIHRGQCPHIFFTLKSHLFKPRNSIFRDPPPPHLTSLSDLSNTILPCVAEKHGGLRRTLIHKIQDLRAFCIKARHWAKMFPFMPPPQSRPLGRASTEKSMARNSVEPWSIKQRPKFPHFGSAYISLRRASMHTLKSLRARSDYLGDNTRQQAWVDFGHDPGLPGSPCYISTRPMQI